MNKYQIIEQLGDGSFGSVLKAKNLENSTIVFKIVTSGRHQENEEEIYLLERMFSLERSKSIIFCSLFNYDLVT